jgi:double-GTPase-like protein
MTGQNSKNYLVFGLSEAGKSTFAAALWHLVDTREVPTVLTKGLHSGNFVYLEKIAKRWSDGWRLERTKSEEVEDARINLHHEESGAEFSLEFRDIAGESLQNAFATRYCDPDFVELVKQADGMLLFVSANYEMDGVTILDVMARLGEADDDLDDDDDYEDEDEQKKDDDPNDGAPVPVEEDPAPDPAKVPLQVRLVDLLQSLRLSPFSKKPFRIAVIVSLWDLAKFDTADEWLAKSMPLLDQFLRGGEIADDVRIYGVSAQGGTYPSKKRENKDDEDRKRLTSIRPASKRIRVVGHGANEHDLTHPVRWLSGLEGEN